MEDRGWQALAWGVAAVVAILVCVRLLGQGAEPPPVQIAGDEPAGRRHPHAPTGRSLFVHVAGAVRRPGLYRLQPGSRVARAVERAGGPRGGADLGAINLAAQVEDGQQILVPARATAATLGRSATASARVSLGAATVEDLEALDGIGPTLAERIVEARQASGGFGSIDDLA